MEIILLHGDHTVKIAERLTKFIDVAKSRGWKVVRIEPGPTVNIKEVLTSQSFFEEKNFYILENPKKLKKSELLWLKKNHQQNHSILVIVNYGQLTKATTASLPKLDKEEAFEIPKKIWAFLDSLYPGNFRLSLVLLHEVLEKDAVELVYYLLARHLRDLFIVKEDAAVLAYHPWRIKKLSLQAQKFTKEGLKKITADLAKADFEAKIGQGDLTSSLDLLIATKLE
ncbi:hypothetical protein HYT59_01870 [Candidatus Woesebacteria bacterium]|nr:hypothetical protein [Candidatus Woesebacteria bacterium]